MIYERGSKRKPEKMHNVELHYLYSLPNIIRVIKLRMMRWAGHAACIQEKKCMQGFRGEN
jgi:hypothetical protein